MAAEQRPVLALDIGGTKLAVAVVTGDGRTHGYRVEPTRREEGHETIIGRLFSLGRQAIADAALGPVAAVGISCGGPLDAASGVLLSPLHLPGWINIPIVELATDAFGVPAVLDNDATAAVLGEYRYGAARGADVALYLTISTGVGGGVIINGKLHRGAAGNGGEFGHIMVRPGGRPCMCGRSGCLEGYASGTSIAARATEAVAASDSNSTSMLALLPEIKGEDVSAAARSGDPLAAEIWNEAVELLSQAITDLVNIFEPHVVVLGGGVTRTGDQLLAPVRAAVLRDAMPPAAATARIEIAALGDEVCVVGAGALAFDRIARSEAASV